MHALFEILQGRFEDGQPLGGRDSAAVQRSIRDHLGRLLNARKGAMPHLPDYGMPDLPSIYEGLPYSLEDLALAVQRLITRYEPRLKHVQVQVRPHDGKDCVVHLDVAGVLADGSFAQFKTYFQSAGRARITAPAGLRGAHA
jgi:type VI secretion system protein